MSRLKSTWELLEDLKGLENNQDKTLIQKYADENYVNGGTKGLPVSNMLFRNNLQTAIEWFGKPEFQKFREFVNKKS
jgi:hypothetical protein